MKSWKNSLKKILISAFCAVMLLCTGFLAFNFQNGGSPAYAYSSSNTPTTAISQIYDQSNDTFDRANLDRLARLAGFSDLRDMVTKASSGTVKTAANFGDTTLDFGKFGNNTSKNLTWIPTYLSKDSSGNAILTLWLSSTATSNGTASSQQEISTFSDGTWNSNKNTTPPSNLYSTSMVRVKTLNNGGTYYGGYGNSETKVTNLTTTNYPAIKNGTNKFEQFTTGNLAQYLVTPSKISWQVNEALSKNDLAYVPADQCYLSGNHYKDWQNDKIWIPSTYEACAASSETAADCDGGLWKTSQKQRSNNTTTMLRTAGPTTTRHMTILNSSGGMNWPYVSSSAGIRPAIHLNLSAIINKAYSPVVVSGQSYEYDGSAKLFTSLPTYDANKMLPIVPKVEGLNNTDVNDYVGIVTLKEGYYVAGKTKDDTTTEVTISITPQKISAPQAVYADFVNETTKIDIAQMSVSKVPWFNASRMTLTYNTADGQAPAKAGTHTVTVTLIPNIYGKSNYYFEGYANKSSVDISLVINGIVIEPSGLNEVYNGTSFADKVKQQSWYTSNVLHIEDIEYDSNSDFTSVGTHTFTVVLKDPDSVSFKDTAPKTKRKTFNVVIAKKPIKLNTLQFNDDGTLKNGYSLFAGYSYDGTVGLPTFALEYQKDGSSIWQRGDIPTTAGAYKVRAYITNPDNCFYELMANGDGENTWTKVKVKVDLPIITLSSDTSTKITSVGYTGSEQSFSLVGLNDNIRIANYSTALYYDGESKTFKATTVGEYSITVALANDGANEEWKDDQTPNKTLNERTITFKIEKVQLEISMTDSAVTSWEQQTRQTLELNVSGVKNNDDIILNIYYSKDGGANTTITYTKSLVVNGTTHITLDIGTFSSGNYKLFVELTKDTINANYTIQNTSPQVASFLITAAAISDLEIVWHANNVKAGMHNDVSSGYERTGATAVSPEFNVNYNGYEFEIKLNEALLPAGVSVEKYENNKFTNSFVTSKTATVTLVVADGYEIFNNPSIKKFTVSVDWKIKPAEFDLADLLWTKTKEYNGTNQGISIADLGNPKWITLGADPLNLPKNVDKYTLTYNLTSSDTNNNYIFTNPTNADWITINETNQDKATVQLSFEITPAKIYLTQQDRGWEAKTKIVDEEAGTKFDYYVPIPTDKDGNKVDAYYDMLHVQYYSQENGSTQIDLNSIQVSDTRTTYYIRVTLNEETLQTGNYVIYNLTKDGAEFATYQFDVGDTRPPVELEYMLNGVVIDFSGDATIAATIEYNGQGNIITVIPTEDKYNYVTFSIAYAMQGAVGETPLPAGTHPTDVGTYRVYVTDMSGNHYIKNRTIYLQITELIVDVDSWNKSDGRNLPTPNIVANMELEDEWFDYEIYDKNGNIYLDKDNLLPNKTYSIKLIAIADFVKFTDDAVLISPTFKLAPDERAVQLGKVEFENNVLEWNNKEQTFVIKDFDIIKDYIENPDEILEALTQTDIDNYSITLKITEGQNAIFEGGLTEWTLTYNIVTRVLEQPKDIDEIGEIRYTGNGINILTYLFGANWESYIEWLEFDTTNGNAYIQTNAKSYTLIFKIKDEVAGNVVWKNTEATALATFAITRDGDTNSTTVEWEILPAKIAGTWNTNGTYPEFILTKQEGDPDFSNKIAIKYYKNGVEVAKENLVDGETYTAQLELLDTDNLELDTESSVKTESEFTYTDPNKKEPGFFEKLLEIIKANWIWFAIGGGVLLFLILLIIIIVVIKKKKKKKAALKAEEEKKAAELKEKEENSKIAELEKKLEVATQNNQQPQQFNNGFVNPQFMGQMAVPTMIYPQQAQGVSEHDKQQDEELKELREAVLKLTKYQTASDDEKEKNKDLATTEDMLKEFLLIEFANNPDWIPFDAEDMIDYNVRELLAIYKLAKKRQAKITKQGNADEQKQFQTESKTFERNYDKYDTMKKDSGYELLLQEVRKIGEEVNKIKADQQANLKIELEKTKQELAESKKHNEALKEQNIMGKIEEATKKNGTQPVQSNEAVSSSSPSAKVDFNVAFNLLPAEQKRYFNTLQGYAMKQPKAAARPTKYQYTIGVGIKPYIKFEIKRNTLVAIFGTTEVKINDEHSVEVAKQMIDTSVKKYSNLQ